MKAFRVSLARVLFRAGLWKLGGLALPEGGVLLLDGGATLIFRENGRVEIRKGTRVNDGLLSRPGESYSDVIVRLARRAKIRRRSVDEKMIKIRPTLDNGSRAFLKAPLYPFQ